jgi:hypothetical protein
MMQPMFHGVSESKSSGLGKERLTVNDTVPPENQKELLLAAYEFARENRNQSDAAAWEMTAIVWGGQTLLLGFVLEAISNRDAQPLIVLAGVLGALMCGFNHVVMRARNGICKSMVDICIEIEKSLSMPTKPQARLSEHYRPGTQRRWFRIINWVFLPVWLAVIAKAVWLYFCLNAR